MKKLKAKKARYTVPFIERQTVEEIHFSLQVFTV
jgi:hypothetical protein